MRAGENEATGATSQGNPGRRDHPTHEMEDRVIMRPSTREVKATRRRATSRWTCSVGGCGR